MENKILKMIFGLCLVVLASACAKDESSPTIASTGYYISNGVCYASGTTTQVNSSYCTTSSSGYYITNGVCYNSSGTALATTYGSVVSGYYIANGICYNSSGVALTSGSTTSTTTTYVWQNGVCVISGTTTAVSSTLCSGTTTGTTCYGYYYQPNYGWGYCQGSNCCGAWLYNQSGQLVYCQ
jgi:hypothetical protein